MFTFSALNYVNVGPEGSFTASGRLTTTPAHIDAIFNHLNATNTKKLAIHFHGGLVDEGAGFDIARKMAPLYADAGCHPVTFIWEAGLIETITRNLTQLHGTKLFKKLVSYVIRHVEKRVGGDVGGRGPGNAIAIDEIERKLLREDAFDRFDAGARGAAVGLSEADLSQVRDEIETELRYELADDNELALLIKTGMAETEHLKPELHEDTTPGARGLIEMATYAVVLATVAYNVLRRYSKGTDHGFYPTVIEEILRELYLADFGFWVWQGMKDAASMMWLRNVGALGDKSHVGTYFLEKLAAHQQARHDFTIDLVGHSAGAIAICELYKAAAERSLPLSVRNLLFLAPACRSDLFLNEIVRHPERFDAFRMYAMSDECETKDHLVSGVYTRSLLYFISGVLEDVADAPITGLARHFSGVAPYDTVDLLEIRGWLTKAGMDRFVLASTGAAGAGLGSDATHHGDFDDDQITRNSLAAVLSA